MNKAIILEARNVSYYTPSGTVLIDNVDLRISEGESVAIAGPNGAGKSTFINILAGIITTVYQFLKVAELVEAHRSSSLLYSKFSRDISVKSYCISIANIDNIVTISDKAI